MGAVQEGARPLDLIWTTDAIAKVIGRSARQTHYMLERGELPMARKVGGRWVVSRAALERFFVTENGRAAC